MVFNKAVVDSILTASPGTARQSPGDIAQQSISPVTHHFNTPDAIDASQAGPPARSLAHECVFAPRGADVAANAQCTSESCPELPASDGSCQLPGSAQHASVSVQLCEQQREPGEGAGQAVTWQQVLQQSMQSAKDIRWTHKGLQVRYISSIGCSA